MEIGKILIVWTYGQEKVQNVRVGSVDGQIKEVTALQPRKSPAEADGACES